MLMKIYRNAALIGALAILSVSAAWGAPQKSALVGSPQKDKDISLERDIGNGVIVTCEGVSLKDSVIYVEYSVFSEEDITVKVTEATALFDDRGGRLDVPRSGSYILIGEDETSEREIIAWVKTAIVVKYPVGAKYELANTYARASVTINGQNLVFRSVPGKK